MRHSQNSISNGAVVWYWHRDSRNWKRGEVIAINKYYLTVKCGHDGEAYTVPSYQTVFPASEAKPQSPAPKTLAEYYKRRGHTFVSGVIKQVNPFKGKK